MSLRTGSTRHWPKMVELVNRVAVRGLGEDLHSQPEQAGDLHPQKDVSFMQADIASVVASMSGGRLTIFGMSGPS